jgi:hypothetical protein
MVQLRGEGCRWVALNGEIACNIPPRENPHLQKRRQNRHYWQMMDATNFPNRMKRFSALRPRLMVAALLGVSAVTAMAHPGHALNASPVAHLLTSPDHLLTLGMIGAALLFTASFVKRLAARRALQWSGATALGLTVLTGAVQLLS